MNPTYRLNPYTNWGEDKEASKAKIKLKKKEEIISHSKGKKVNISHDDQIAEEQNSKNDFEKRSIQLRLSELKKQKQNISGDVNFQEWTEVNANYNNINMENNDDPYSEAEAVEAQQMGYDEDDYRSYFPEMPSPQPYDILDDMNFNMHDYHGENLDNLSYLYRNHHQGLYHEQQNNFPALLQQMDNQDLGMYYNDVPRQRLGFYTRPEVFQPGYYLVIAPTPLYKDSSLTEIYSHEITMPETDPNAAKSEFTKKRLFWLNDLENITSNGEVENDHLFVNVLTNENGPKGGWVSVDNVVFMYDYENIPQPGNRLWAIKKQTYYHQGVGYVFNNIFHQIPGTEENNYYPDNYPVPN